MNKILLTLILIISSFNLIGQKPTKKLYSYKPRLNGISFGVNSSNFYRDNKNQFQSIPKNPNLGLNAGLIFDILNQKRFSSQLQIKYSKKGSKETFFNKSNVDYISTKSSLNYLQVEILPLVFKPLGFEKFNPYFSAGGYFSYLLNSKFEYQFTEVFDYKLLHTQNMSVENINKKDIGFIFNAGIKFNLLSIEYKHEIGLNRIIGNKEIRNQLNSVAFKFTKF